MFWEAFLLSWEFLLLAPEAPLIPTGVHCQRDSYCFLLSKYIVLALRRGDGVSNDNFCVTYLLNHPLYDHRVDSICSIVFLEGEF